MTKPAQRAIGNKAFAAGGQYNVIIYPVDKHKYGNGNNYPGYGRPHDMPTQGLQVIHKGHLCLPVLGIGPSAEALKKILSV